MNTPNNIQHNPNLPSGYISAEQLQANAFVDQRALPWLDEPYGLSIANCGIEGGKTFLVASAIGSHPRLIAAAEGMTDKQRHITDNMFYARIASYIESGYASNVETLPKAVTTFPIHVMRNNGGQRVYFGVPRLDIAGDDVPVVLRLAVCDKNKQSEVMKVLSASSPREIRQKTTK